MRTESRIDRRRASSAIQWSGSLWWLGVVMVTLCVPQLGLLLPLLIGYLPLGYSVSGIDEVAAVSAISGVSSGLTSYPFLTVFAVLLILERPLIARFLSGAGFCVAYAAFAVCVMTFLRPEQFSIFHFSAATGKHLAAVFAMQIGIGLATTSVIAIPRLFGAWSIRKKSDRGVALVGISSMLEWVTLGAIVCVCLKTAYDVVPLTETALKYEAVLVLLPSLVVSALIIPLMKLNLHRAAVRRRWLWVILILGPILTAALVSVVLGYIDPVSAWQLNVANSMLPTCSVVTAMVGTAATLQCLRRLEFELTSSVVGVKQRIKNSDRVTSA